MNLSPEQNFSLEQAISAALQHHQDGRLADAELAYRQAITIKPDYAEVYINLGNVLYELDRLEEAKEAYCQAISIAPDCALAHCNLGNLFYVLGRRDEAAAAYHQAITFRPDYPEAYCNIGNVFYDAGRFDEAAEAYRHAITIKPDFAEAHSNLGNALQNIGLSDEAEAAFRQAIDVRPDYAEAYSNLGNVLKDLCRLEEAVAACRRSITLKQHFPMSHSNLLLTHQYMFLITREEAFGEALDFGKRFEETFRATWSRHLNINDPDKRLKVGFVSGDLRNHPVGFFLEKVLEHLDRASIALFAYANQFKYDALSERIRPYFDEWVSVKSMNDEELASRIHGDGIDILIDLAGHTADNRLLVFARKPAPVQVTWLGYPNTTGLHAIDYILADPITVPPEEEKFYTEKIWRLPESYICFTPPVQEMAISPLPALVNGYITFGSFNNPVKINDTVIACWAKILLSVPCSVLLFKNGHLDSKAIRESFRQRFLNCGVGPERLLFEGSSSRSEILASYQRIDIALDPFPYTGTTTTCEGLWMGVPSLTLKMSRGIYSHTGELIMKSVGLTNWVAESVGEYVGKAQEFANDLQGIARIRPELREILFTSPLCNAPRFALNLESALRGMWQQWCQLKHSNDPQLTKPKRKLHIGGTVRAERWEVLSISDGPNVDHVGNANDLSRFTDNTFSEIYASHVLEHFDYKGELLATLAEWHRVLEPGGVLSVSVPDLDILATLYLDKTRQTIDDRFLLMSMIFGGHADDHDYHNVGLNEELLSHCLKMAGFVEASRVAKLGVFEDTSDLRFKGECISLNMVAYKQSNCDAVEEPNFTSTPKSERCYESNVSTSLTCSSNRKLLIESWRSISHSFAVANQWLVLSLRKRGDLDLYFKDVEYYNPQWTPMAGLYSKQDETYIAELKKCRVEESDMVFRLSFPFDFSPLTNRKLAVFATSEFKCLSTNSFKSFDDFTSSINNSKVKIFTPSNWSAEGFYRNGCCPSRVVIVPLGVDTDTFHPSAEARRKMRLHLGLNGFVFMSVGAMTQNKGIDLLLRAFAAVVVKRPEARLLLKGADGLYSSHKMIEKCLADLTIKDRETVINRLIYHGEFLSMAEMSDFYQAADAYVSPYRAEGFNIPVLEAAACGVPVICTGGGSTDDFVTDGFARKIASKTTNIRFHEKYGEILEPDLDHLIYLMVEIIDDQRWRNGVAHSAVNHISKKFTWDIVADQIITNLFSKAWC